MTWYRVFCALQTAPSLVELQQVLARLGVSVSATLESDGDDWESARLHLGDCTLELHRYLADQEGIRTELNSWAGVLEMWADHAISRGLMERTIQARQLIYFEASAPALESLGLVLASHLASALDGFFQVDGQGFFTADGVLRVSEPDE
ncbi:MAG: hypothetical protein U0840_08480 [Gemmataceae bacterium]